MLTTSVERTNQEAPIDLLIYFYLRDRDKLSTKDKRPVPNVSVIRSFTVSLFVFLVTQ